MTAEDIIQQILSKHPEVTRDQILETLQVEKSKTGGLIAEETLLRLIAARYGVEILQNRVYHHLSITHLVPGLNDVTITGRVLAVYPPKTFEGERSGKFANLLIADKDSILHVVLWNDNVDLIESGELKTDQIVRFHHGYTREGRKGKAELHLGSKSRIEVEPQNVKADEYPSIGSFATKISEITKPRNTIHLSGTVKTVFPASTFTRSDMSTGTVLRLTLADETGEIPVVAWNEKAEELEKAVKVNAGLRLVNARVKEASNGGFEVHVNSYTYVDVSAVAKPQLTKIADLNENLNSINVEGEVASVLVNREVTTSKGETVKLAVFELKDETGVVRVSAWREHAEIASSLHVGDRVLIENAYAKKGFEDKIELSTRNATSITVRAS
jgi:ssDNA-binding replication factor A large subunit